MDQEGWEVPVLFGPRGSPSAAARDVVALRVPAVGAYLSVLRTTTAGLAARWNFTLDEMEDLQIAVDEACAALLPTAVPGADLDVEFGLTGDVMCVSVTVLTLNGAQPARDTFAWAVLSALAGSVDSHAGPDNRVTIVLQKQRAGARHEAE